MQGTEITVRGNLTADPELRFISSGAAVVSFTIAATERVWSRDENKMVDGDTLFLRCSAWRDQAEHITESLKKGQRVIATGLLKQREWQAEDGSKRYATEMQVSEVGPSLLFAIARPERPGTPPARQAAAASPRGGSADDPWAAGPPPTDEPPF